MSITPRSESGGLPFGLHLDSTAPRSTEAGAPLWLHRPMHQGTLTKCPSLLSLPNKERWYRPRVFYPCMVFLQGTQATQLEKNP